MGEDADDLEPSIEHQHQGEFGIGVSVACSYVFISVADPDSFLLIRSSFTDIVHRVTNP